MNTRADKAKENKSQTAADSVPRKKSSSATFQFVDNRPEAITQQRLQAMADTGPQVKQLMDFQESADNSLQANPTAQLLGKANNNTVKFEGESFSNGPSIQIAKNRTVDHHSGVPSQNSQSESETIQLAAVFGNNNTLTGVDGRVNWHFWYDDANLTSLHITISDHQNYDLRTWASRQSYTPTGVDSGYWSGWISNLGVTPGWALGLVGTRGQNPALQAFHRDANITTLLGAQFPQAVPTASQFPAL